MRYSPEPQTPFNPHRNALAAHCKSPYRQCSAAHLHRHQVLPAEHCDTALRIYRQPLRLGCLESAPDPAACHLGGDSPVLNRLDSRIIDFFRSLPHLLNTIQQQRAIFFPALDVVDSSLQKVFGEDTFTLVHDTSWWILLRMLMSVYDSRESNRVTSVTDSSFWHRPEICVQEFT